MKWWVWAYSVEKLRYLKIASEIQNIVPVLKEKPGFV